MKKIINGINSSNDLRVICLNLNERIDPCERGVHHTGISDFFNGIPSIVPYDEEHN